MAKSCDRCTTGATYTARGFQGGRAIHLPPNIPINEVENWTVSILNPKLFQQHGLLFESSNDKRFCIDIFLKGDEVILRANGIDLDDMRYKKLTKKPLGTARISAKSIVQTATAVLEKFGSYHTLLHNSKVECKHSATYLYIHRK